MQRLSVTWPPLRLRFAPLRVRLICFACTQENGAQRSPQLAQFDANTGCYNRRVLSDAPLTKRQLGALIVAGGVIAALAVLLVDVFRAGAFVGLGPAQLLALGGCALVILLGLSLLPLGDRLA